MPRNGSGTFTVPITYTPNTLASAADVNSNFTDVANALTGSLPRDGQAGMSGQLKLADGALETPGLTFDADPDTGMRRSGSNTLRLVAGGVDIIQISSAGLTLVSGALTGAGTTPVGSGMDYWGTSAPTGWLFAYGQAVSRTTYAALFAALGTAFGSGDGSTTFNLPDKRGRASFGKDNMGGTSANRITVQSGGGGWDGDVLGATGGSETHTLTVAQMPSHRHTGFTDSAGDHVHGQNGTTGGSAAQVATGTNVTALTSPNNFNTGAAGAHTHPFSTSDVGSSAAHNNLPPGITCNYIIFAGA